MKNGWGERPGGRGAGNQLHGLRDRHFDFSISHTQGRAWESMGCDNRAKTVVIAGDRTIVPKLIANVPSRTKRLSFDFSRNANALANHGKPLEIAI